MTYKEHFQKVAIKLTGKSVVKSVTSPGKSIKMNNSALSDIGKSFNKNFTKGLSNLKKQIK